LGAKTELAIFPSFAEVKKTLNLDDRLPADSAHYLREGVSVTATRYERAAVTGKLAVPGPVSVKYDEISGF
jgi:hypothetical protein